MKIRIKTHNGELPSYLTVGKVYEYKELKSYCGLVLVDNGLEYFTYLNGSAHLNGGSWEVVGGQTAKYSKKRFFVFILNADSYVFGG